MSPVLRQQIQREADFIQECAAYYRRQFEQVIRGMNHAPAGADGQCLRLCVEAVDVLMVTQDRLAKVLEQMGREEAGTLKKAA